VSSRSHRLAASILYLASCCSTNSAYFAEKIGTIVNSAIRPPVQAMTAVAELKQQHAVTDDDLLVCIANYGSGPEQVPQLVSITQQF
jgi:hypothetical protein